MKYLNYATGVTVGAILITTLTATQVAAHPSHLADLAGHDHWVAGAAAGAAVLATLWGILKDRKPKSEPVEEPATEEEVTA